MGGEDHPGVLQEGVVLGRGLLGKDVQAGGEEVPLLQHLQKGLFVHDAAPGGVHHHRPPGKEVEFPAADHPPGLLGQGGVHGEEVALAEEVLQVLQKLHPQALGPGPGDVGIVGQDPHLKALGEAGHLAADAAQAHDAQGLALKLQAQELAVPLPRADLAVGEGDAPGGREEEAEGQLGGRAGVGLGDVHHQDAQAARRLQVHVVHPHPAPAHHLEALAPL